MKVLIWFLALLLNSVITTALNMGAGITLGAIPTMLLWMITIYPAYKLCQKWDVHIVVKKAKEKNCKPIDILLAKNSQEEKAALESCRGNEKKLTQQIKNIGIKKQYRSFYVEYFMKASSFDYKL